MDFVNTSEKDGIVTLSLNRGKVNPLNGGVVEEILSCLNALEGDSAVKAVILTGQGKFFSFGFDVPELLTYSREAFSDFLTKFTNLYSYMFLYPKPIIAALNGHTIAGGCMLALACDRRIMISGKSKISLNEVDLGVPVFTGITEILRFCVGSRNATEILYSGTLYSPEQAYSLGLVDEVVSTDDLTGEANKAASDLANKPWPAFNGIKSLLRKPILQDIEQREKASIMKFVDIWYSDSTREILKNVKIKS
ncbi:MAG TPA: enoyl-CoA hydratase/isomerase family protein [Deltaproteobacteria bacterium]|nr:enoyl-CoA hydratase/isomerase family protein [Deltaproteobacteria bacterium]